jgi:hypothetical protein
MSNTMNATIEAGTTYHSGAPDVVVVPIAKIPIISSSIVPIIQI